MLLIDDDQPEIGERQEEGRARAHHHGGVAQCHGAPGLAPAARRELGMPFGGRGGEACGEPRVPLGAQRDFGEQDERLATRAERGGYGLEIDLGLARAGDAVEEGRRKLLRCGPGGQLLGGRALLGRKRRAEASGVGPGERRLAGTVLGCQPARLCKAGDDAASDPGFAHDLGRGHGRAVGQQRQHPAPRAAVMRAGGSAPGR